MQVFSTLFCTYWLHYTQKTQNKGEQILLAVTTLEISFETWLDLVVYLCDLYTGFNVRVEITGIMPLRQVYFVTRSSWINQKIIHETFTLTH